MSNALTLAAEDAADLEIISARLQDAVAQMKDLVYLPKKRRFAALFNRFLWEGDEKKGDLRVRSGLHFEGVLSVKSHKLKRGAPDSVVSLLAIQFTPKGGEDPGGTVELVFAGGGAMRLEVEVLDAGLTDLAGPWAAMAGPNTKKRDMARRLDASAPDFAAQFDALLNAKREVEEDVAHAVRGIIKDVRARGDDAVVELTNTFDHAGVTTATLRLTEAEIGAAEAHCTKAQLDALDVAAKRIESYHRRQLPKDDWFTDATGAQLGWRWTSLDSVGLYVPGGTAAYPSSVLMNAVPARVAGVKRIVMVTPASGGKIMPLVLAAAKRAGVAEIYRVGGAQAVAALAYGTATIAPVDKIVGPGNAYVAAAKREVFGKVGIDSIAGPSEILVVADGHNNPDWIAADLLSQAEHDASSQSVLVTDDAGFAAKVEEAAERALKLLPREKIARASWTDYGGIIVVAKLGDAAPLVNAIAPEHLEIATADPQGFAAKVRHAGAIFLGRYTPEAMGDYIAGPNHVLPTSRTARFSSGLSVLDFMKRTTLLHCEPGTVAQIGPDAIVLAEAEGLDAHARSIAARLNQGQ